MSDDVRKACAHVTFRKSSFSGGQNGSCVEVANTDELFGVRDSKNVDGPILLFGAAEGTAFVRAVCAGDLR